MIKDDLPLKDSQNKAFFISGSFHALFLLFLIAQGLLTPAPKPTSKKLLVQSIALSPQSPEKNRPKKADVLPSPLPPQQEIAAVVPEVIEPEPVQEIPEPEETKEVALKEEPVSFKEERSPVKEEPKPVPQEKAQKLPSKQKAPQKPTAKKASPPPKPTKKKEQKAKPSSPKKQTPKEPAKPSYDKTLVAEALDRLNRSQKATQSTSTSKNTNAATSRSVGSVGTLHSDTGVSSREPSTESNEFRPNSSEGCYITDLIRRLKLNIRLSEPGEIRIKLTLKKSGQVGAITVVSCRNEKIKKSLLEKLKSVHFSAFGQSFPGEQEHTFLLKLSNDLSWSCS